MISGIILLTVTAAAWFAGASFTSVLGAQALGMLVWTGALGIAIRKKWPLAMKGQSLNSHKWTAYCAVSLTLLHVIVAIAAEPDRARYFMIFDAPPRGAAAVGALVMLLCTIGLGEYRKHTNLASDRWKLFHGVTALLAVLLGFTHMVWLDNLIYSTAFQIVFFLTFIASVVLVGLRLR